MPALLVVALAAGSCGGPTERPVRIDSLATDAERLMLVDHLPAGLPEEEARKRLPSFGPVTDGRASASLEVLGLPATVVVEFREGAVTACGYRLAAADSAVASTVYKELQRFYTTRLGNYHEEFAGEGRPARSFWSSADYGLLVTLGRHHTEFTLVWTFRPLPGPGEEPQPAV